MTKRLFGIVFTTLLTAALYPGTGAQAQTFPAGPIQVVLPAPPGGTLDSALRVIAEKASSVLGQRVLAVNRTGAGGNIAGEVVAHSKADGYTLLLGYDAIHATNPHIYKNLSFDGVKDFAPIALIGSFPIVMTVRADFPAKTLAEFVKYAKANPGKVTYGTPGVGSTHHLMAETLAHEAGIRIMHVPYKGADGVSTDLAGGRIDVGFFSLASAQKMVQLGKGRNLVTAEPKRIAAIPDVPTLAETYPGTIVQTWFGLLAPKGTDANRIVKLAQAFHQAIGDRETQAKLTQMGVAVMNEDAKALSTLMHNDYAKRGDILRAMNVQLD